MTEQNPHQHTGRFVAFACYFFAGLMLVAGIFFTLAAATMDMPQLSLQGVTNQRMAIMIASIFLIVVLMIVLLGWRIQSLFGQQHRQEKLAAKLTVGCLRLGGLGIALWAVPSTVTVLLTGKMLATGELAGFREIFVGISGFVLAILLMLSVAWFISANFVRPILEERQSASLILGIRYLFQHIFNAAVGNKFAIKNAPGSKLLSFADFFWPPKTVKQVFEPLIADWRTEYFDALKQGRIWKAQWISVRYRIAFVQAIGLSTAWDMVKGALSVVKK